MTQDELAELQVLRTQYEDENEKGWVSVTSQFNLAWGLIKSDRREDIIEGLGLLMGIYRKEASRRRECLYYIGLGHYKLGNFEDARKFNALLLKHEPYNVQASSLQELIDHKAKQDGLVAVGLVGAGLFAVVGIITAASLGWRRR